MAETLCPAQRLPGPAGLDPAKARRKTAAPGAGGPCYQWTRKLKGKTVSVALSKEQYEGLAAAIANWRTVQSTLKAMQRLSRSVLFTTLPGTRRRKRLSTRKPSDLLKRHSASALPISAARQTADAVSLGNEY